MSQNNTTGKFYISDLDNTLLDGRARLSEYSRNELNRLIEEGLLFSVASTRSISSMKSILYGLNLRLPVVEFNGAFITDFVTGRHLVVNSIQADAVGGILSIIRKHGNEPFVSSFNGSEDKLYYQSVHSEGMKWYLEDRIKNRDDRLEKVENVAGRLNEQIVCFNIINRKEKLLNIYNILADEYGDILEILLMENFYSPGWFWLTVHDRKATKDKAISWLLAKESCSHENLVVFGDDVSDIPVFKLASVSVAVGGAEDSLKKIATHIIGNSSEDSVVKYISRDFSGNKK